MVILRLGVESDKSSLTNTWHRFCPKMMFEKKMWGKFERFLCPSWDGVKSYYVGQRFIKPKECWALQRYIYCAFLERWGHCWNDNKYSKYKDESVEDGDITNTGERMPPKQWKQAAIKGSGWQLRQIGYKNFLLCWWRMGKAFQTAEATD